MGTAPACRLPRHARTYVFRLVVLPPFTRSSSAMWQLLSLIAVIGAPLELLRRVEGALPSPPAGAPTPPSPADPRPPHPHAKPPSQWTFGRAFHGVSRSASPAALGQDIWASKRAGLDEDPWAAVRGCRAEREAGRGGGGLDAVDLGGPLMRPLPSVVSRRVEGDVSRVTVRTTPEFQGTLSQFR